MTTFFTTLANIHSDRLVDEKSPLQVGFFFIFFRGITGSTSSKLCHECGNSLLRVSWVGEQRRRGPSERGRERSEDAERSWRSINEILAGQSHRDAVLAVLHHCFQAWSAGLKAPQSGTISPFKTSFSGLIYSRKKKKWVRDDFA